MPESCPICTNQMTQRVASWSFYCEQCDYWSANLTYDIESRSDGLFAVESAQEAIAFLDAVRVRNFTILLDRARQILGDRRLRILDVGCATGLFLQMAKARGHDVFGLEPNPLMAAGARKNGLDVIEGYFPDAAPAGDFDLITFNDVFEHIPQLDGILDGVKAKLHPNGLLVLNLPSSRGFLFHLGQFSFRLGIKSLWHRLWQTMFYTPHLHFFNERSLDRFVGRFGIASVAPPVELSTVSLDGLWDRVSADRQAPLAKRLFTYVAAICVYPFLSLFPKDTFAAFYRPRS